MERAVHADTPEGIVDGLLAFDGAVDHAIVRAITPTHDVEHYLRLLDAIAPLALIDRAVKPPICLRDRVNTDGTEV